MIEWKKSLHSWRWRIWPPIIFKSKKKTAKVLPAPPPPTRLPWQPSSVINYREFEKLE